MPKTLIPLRSYRRLPYSRDSVSLVSAGPGRHCDPNRFEWLAAVATELELRTGWERDEDARSHLGDFFAVAEPAPHPPTARREAPDFLDGAMGDRPRHGARHQTEGGHAAARERAQQTNLRAVRRDRIWRGADFPGLECHRRHPTQSIIAPRSRMARQTARCAH